MENVMFIILGVTKLNNGNKTWGNSILKNTKLGSAAQTKPSPHAYIFVTTA